MSANIERLLRLTADYHNFCSDAHKQGQGARDEGELSLEELELITAAAAAPIHDLEDATEEKPGRRW